MPANSDDRQSILVRAASHPNKAVVRWFETATKVHDEQAIARMLEHFVTDQLQGWSALHIAAWHGHSVVAAQLLTEDPSLADVKDEFGLEHSAPHSAPQPIVRRKKWWLCCWRRLPT